MEKRIFARTRSKKSVLFYSILVQAKTGKSVLVNGILIKALSRGIPIVALDYPKPDGTSTFSDYTEFIGEQEAYFDIGKQFTNLFEIPDLSTCARDDDL